MKNRFRLLPLLRRGLLVLPLVGGLAPMAMAQCPITNTCTPGAATDPDAPIFGQGISNVTLNTLNRTTAIGDGHQDYSCITGGSTSLLAGAVYPLTVTTASTDPERVRVWVDFDNNGIFNATTELVFDRTATGVHTGTLTVPASAVLNTALRMRVTADDASSPVMTPCSSPQYGQTEDYAVTILPNTSPPVAGFAADTVTCSGIVRFTDQSSGAPTSWLWNFGDGNTSTQQNPTHTYAAAGRYTISFTATNANGTNTVTRANYIRYNTQVPIAASCTPQTVAYCCNYGISRVRFATIDRASGNGSLGYEDATCSSRALVAGGNTYQLVVKRSGTLAQDFRAWIDYNNDGIFTANELILTALAQDSAVAQVAIPLSAPINTPLRLRISSDAVGQVSGPCAPPQIGQVEDYTVIVRANTLPPVAAFTVDASGPCDSTKTFRDVSQNAPTSWLWYFGDGATSTLQNPTHTYTTTGTFTVSLVTNNAFGSDSTAQVGAAFVTLPCRTYCIPTNLQTQSIWINRVEFAGIDRASVLDPGAYIATYNPPARLILGQSASLTVTTSTTGGGGGGPPVFTTSAWIDYNQNSVWETSERVFQAQGDPNNLALQGFVTVPASANAGPTMMRILTTRNQQLANNPCPPNNAPGIEVEDYLVVISGPQTPPRALFLTNDSVSCSGLVQFTDRSLNAPTSWTWNFGDNSPVSTERNPLHQYPTTPNTYTVKLVVRNAYGLDSITRVAAVRVIGGAVPAAPTCRPPSTSPSFGLGIDSVRVRALGSTLANSTPDDTDGYRDYTCGRTAVIYRGKAATIRVTTIQPMNGRVIAWIDYNNDGQFGFVNERVLLSANSPNGVNEATFTVPGTAPLNTPLRLRVGSDWANLPVLQPCGSATQPQYGQMEDYTVIVRDTVLATANLREPLALSVAPNPTVDGRVLVRLTGEVPGTAAGAPLTLTVRSVLGQVVLRRTLTVRPGAGAEVDLSSLTRGVYVVQTDGPAAALRGTIRLVRD